MKDVYERYAGYLSAEDKAAAVKETVRLLDAGEIAVSDLYERVLAPLLNALHCPENDETCIWREHVRTAIVRAVVEVAYPYVLRAKEAAGFRPVGKKVLVVCPPEEYHEIGARMAADFFELAGFDVTFVGANTPNRDVLSAVRHVRPDAIAVSVTNYYNLVKARTLVQEIAALVPEARIILGGAAFRDPAHVAVVGRGEPRQAFAAIRLLAEEMR